MTRGRKPKPVPSVQLKMYVPVNIATEMELLLHDPVSGKTTHGARSALITKLLSEWIEKQRKLPPLPQPASLTHSPIDEIV